MWAKVITQVLIHFGTILAQYLMGLAKKAIDKAKFKKQAEKHIETARKYEENDSNIDRNSLP